MATRRQIESGRAPGCAPVVGVGITRIGDGYALKVNLSESVADNAVPDDVDGVPIKAEVVGAIRKR